MPKVITLTISSSGLGYQDRKVLQSAIAQLTHAGKPFQMVDSNVADHAAKNAANAQLLVLDDDSESGRALLRQSRSGQVKLVLSSNPRLGRNVIGIKKPLDITKLMLLLTRIFEKMQSQLSAQRLEGHVVTQPGDNQVQESDLQQSLDQTLFGVLMEAKSENLVLRVSAPDCDEIFIDGINRSIATSATRESLRKLIQKSREHLWIENILETEFEAHGSALDITTLYSILWIAAIQCSRGRILPGHDPSTPVKLRAWPNFTRNDFRAEHLKLAAVLARQATPLVRLQALTQVPYPDIVNFYNAAYAVDIIDINPVETHCAPAEKTVTQQMKNLFNRIARRLSFG